MTEVFQALDWVSVGGVIWLAFILQLVYLRVYREPFLRLWSFSFAVLAIQRTGQLLTVHPSSPEIVGSAIPVLIGIPQFVLIAAAALSLKPPTDGGRRRGAWLLAGITAGLFGLFLVTAMVDHDPLRLGRDLRLDRHLEGAATGVWFALAFWRYHPLARTVGGRVLVSLNALHAVHNLAVAAAILGFPPYPGPYSVAVQMVSIGLLFAISGGMIVLASEAMIATSKKLRDSEERYRTLVETSPDGIVATDPAGTILMCNRRAAEVHGYSSADELIGTQAPFLVAPADRARVRTTIRSAATEDRRVSLECQILLRDGSERSAELTAAPLRTADGGIGGAVTIEHDITARKAADRALRAEREFSAQAINAIPGIFFVLDRAGKLVKWNRNLETLLAVPAGRIPALDPFSRFHPEDRQRVAEAMEAIFANGSAEVEARSRGESGAVRHFYLTGRRMETEGAAYVVGCGVDITERIEAEAARARLEAQLSQSRKLESIGRLAGGVAHDFNNHLTVINGYCDLLVSQLEPGDPQRDVLTEVRQAGERAAALTRQLLAFGRKQRISPNPVSLNSIVSSMEPMLRRLVPENIEIVADLAPDLGATMADAGQIEQVVMNLALNARDAMPEGGRLRIETANLDLDSASRDSGVGPGRYVTLAVVDTGTGMDERTRGMIFEPFFSTKVLGKGTGLGLATVYGIVKQSGGAITVRSAPGKGSAFTVYLPHFDGRVSDAPAAPVLARTPSGQGTILLVEDQGAVRGLLARVLTSFGYRVIEAGNASQAMDLPDSQVESLDLLITDLVMPGMSGRELAAQMTARRNTLRVLFISGYAPDATGGGIVLDSHAAFLQKPFSPQQLTAKVGEMLAAV
jgi:PAS domain S-box-containing protein